MAADVEKLIKDAGEHADELRRVGFHCPEAVLRGTARALGLQVDEGVLRATTGLRGGGGGAGDRCGALEGGAILIGFLYGRIQPEEDNSCASQLVRWLHTRFDCDLGSTACRMLRPMSHLHWSDDFSCGPVYRKGAELAAEAVLTAHQICATCPPFDLASGRAPRVSIDKDALGLALDRVHALGAAQRVHITDEAQTALVRLGVAVEEVGVSLATARRVHPAWGGALVVEGRRRDHWYLTTAVRIRADDRGGEVVEVLAIL